MNQSHLVTAPPAVAHSTPGPSGMCDWMDHTPFSSFLHTQYQGSYGETVKDSNTISGKKE